jgi:hypothetical protein
MAGVAFAGEGDGVGFATESYAASALYATLANLSGARWRIKAAREEFDVSLTVAHITPLISLLAGLLILVAPALLNYIVAIYLIVAGLVGLNEIHHFFS